MRRCGGSTGRHFRELTADDDDGSADAAHCRAVRRSGRRAAVLNGTRSAGTWRRIGEALGQPFMPWQSLIADVGCEIDGDTGLPAYRRVIVTVPRQQGKTTLFLSWQINRCTVAAVGASAAVGVHGAVGKGRAGQVAG